MISVIVRVRDEAAALERLLGLLRGQLAEQPVELIVVDHESRDGSDAVARRHGAVVLPISVAEFSFGRALNRGAQAASGELLVALSAHAFPLDDSWLARLEATFEDPAVACACGERFNPRGERLQSAFRYDAEAAQRWPAWGYANAAGGFRASLWRERPFRDDLPACEDKEWGRHWALAGHPTVLDPALAVEHDHTHDPVRQIYRRAWREAAGYTAFLGEQAPTPDSLTDLAREWWSDTRFYSSAWRARCSHRRAARLLGAYAGRKGAG